jgi:spore coat protein CotH
MRSGALLFLLLVPAGCHAPWPDGSTGQEAFAGNAIREWSLDMTDENRLRLIADPGSMTCQGGGLGPTCQDDAGCPAGCACQEGACRWRWVEADIEVDGMRISRVGVRITGDRREAKPNLRVRFDVFVPGQRLYSLSSIALRSNRDDPSQIRERLALELFRQSGLCAPWAAFAWVKLNGEDLGLYTQVQRVDRKLLATCFGEDSGNLYRLHAGADLVLRGERPEDFDPPFAILYEKTTNEGSADVSDLMWLMRVLAAQDLGGIESILDTDEFLRWLAVNGWLANLDSYPGTGGNVYLYRDASGRFRIIPWDLARALGNYRGPACALSADDMMALDLQAPTCGDPRPLVDRLLAVPALRAVYRRHLLELTNSTLAERPVMELSERLHASIREAAHRDENKGFSDAEFDAALEQDTPPGTNPTRALAIRPFVQARDRAAREALK